jgi:hypothetical protein
MDPHGAVSIPLQGFEFVPADAGPATVRLQCYTTSVAGGNIFATGKLQAIKVATLTNSP